MRAYAGPITFWLDRRSNYFTYILLAKGASAEALEQKLPDFMEKYSGELRRRMGTLNTLMPTLQHLPDIHLKSNLEREWEPNGSFQNVVILASIAVFVLLIACFNFMNLSTARSALRAHEVALRKLVGAERIRLVRQFLVESVFLTALATVLAMGIAHLLLPMIDAVTGRDLRIGYLSDPWILPGLLILLILVGLLSGFYPALVLSSFRPVVVLKGAIGSGSGGKTMRQILITLQFAVSIFLLIGLGVISSQMSMVRTKDLGYEKDNVVIIPLPNETLRANYQVYKEAILTDPEVLAASGSNTVMGKAPVTREARPSDAGDDANMSYELIESDEDFLKVYRMQLIAGRDFSVDMGDETAGAVILNQEAVKGLGLTDAVDAAVSKIKPVQPKKVIGVVKNFHMESLHVPIRPVIISLGRSEPYQYLSVRIGPLNTASTVDFLRERWAEINPGAPFAYSFFDQDYDALYRSEQRLGRLFLYFTSLALTIACLGMVGLVSFIAERRSKEIGIRKILGASVPNIALMLLKEFGLLIAAANLIAWPLAYYAMSAWLQDFAYRTPIGLGLFAGAALLVLLIAFFSVSLQTFRAANADPIRALRYE
jgi:putative ABC transport system permease protein